MDIEIEIVKIKDKKKLKQMLKDYQLEMSGDKACEYKYFDLYWKKENRFPLFIKDKRRIVGFALINGHTIVNKNGVNLAEFYVVKKYRRTGVGTIAAKKIFKMIPGEWEVRQIRINRIGHIFWKKVISEYSNGNFHETTMKNKVWDGWIQTFKV